MLQIWVVLLIEWKFASTDQKHYPLILVKTRHQYGVQHQYTPLSDIISRGNQKWRREMSAVFSKYPLEMLMFLLVIKTKVLIVFQMA